MELQHLEVRPLRAELADEVQDQVFRPDELLEAPGHDDLDRRRHFHIQYAAQGPDARHLGRADAERKRAQRAMARRVGVRPHHDVARAHIAILRQDLVADAAHIAPDVVELPDALGADELPHLFVVGGGLRRFCRHAMIEDHGDAARVPDAGGQGGALVDFEELIDHQRRILMRHG